MELSRFYHGRLFAPRNRMSKNAFLRSGQAYEPCSVFDARFLARHMHNTKLGPLREKPTYHKRRSCNHLSQLLAGQSDRVKVDPIFLRKLEQEARQPLRYAGGAEVANAVFQIPDALQ